MVRAEIIEERNQSAARNAKVTREGSGGIGSLAIDAQRLIEKPRDECGASGGGEGDDWGALWPVIAVRVAQGFDGHDGDIGADGKAKKKGSPGDDAHGSGDAAGILHQHQGRDRVKAANQQEHPVFRARHRIAITDQEKHQSMEHQRQRTEGGSFHGFKQACDPGQAAG